MDIKRVPRPTSKQPIAPQTSPVTPATQPHLRRRPFLKRLTRLHWIIIGGTIVGFVIICSVIIYFVFDTTQTPPVNSPTTSDPGYQTVLPDGKSITEYGGWTRVSPKESDPVYAYNDTIDDVAVTISQQPLPVTFQGDVDAQVEELAKRFNATNKITAGSVTAYLGTSAKGPQSVIFTTGDVLVLMKSESTLTNERWSRYIESMKDAAPATIPRY